MPNRILKESICTSDTIDSLKGWFDEVVYYRLIVNCDDYGRFDGRPAIIKSRLFPLRGNVTDKSVDEAVRRLASAGLVILYEKDGKPYLCLPTWDRHQQVRAKKSRYPALDDACKQMISDDCKCPRNPIQSESESNTKELSGKPDPHSHESDVTEDRPGVKPPAKQARFAPPALEEVAGYCKERRNAVDAQRFVDYYTANGWKVGKNPMKDWRAAVRNWERGGFSQGKTQNGEALPADRVLAGGPSPAPKWGVGR